MIVEATASAATGAQRIALTSREQELEFAKLSDRVRRIAQISVAQPRRRGAGDATRARAGRRRCASSRVRPQELRSVADLPRRPDAADHERPLIDRASAPALRCARRDLASSSAPPRGDLARRHALSRARRHPAARARASRSRSRSTSPSRGCDDATTCSTIATSVRRTRRPVRARAARLPRGHRAPTSPSARSRWTACASARVAVRKPHVHARRSARLRRDRRGAQPWLRRASASRSARTSATARRTSPRRAPRSSLAARRRGSRRARRSRRPRRSASDGAGAVPQPDGRVATTLAPLALLRALQRVETPLGRVRARALGRRAPSISTSCATATGSCIRATLVLPHPGLAQPRLLAARARRARRVFVARRGMTTTPDGRAARVGARVGEAPARTSTRVTALLDEWAASAAPADRRGAAPGTTPGGTTTRCATRRSPMLRELAGDAPGLHAGDAARAGRGRSPARATARRAPSCSTRSAITPWARREWGRLGRALYMADYLEPGRKFSRADRAYLAAQVPHDFDGDLPPGACARGSSGRCAKACSSIPRRSSLWNAVR